MRRAGVKLMELRIERGSVISDVVLVFAIRLKVLNRPNTEKE